MGRSSWLLHHFSLEHDIAVAKTAAAQADAPPRKWQGLCRPMASPASWWAARARSADHEDVATFIQKRSAVEERAHKICGAWGQPPSPQALLSAAKGSALGWLSGATGGEKKPIRSPKPADNCLPRPHVKGHSRSPRVYGSVVVDSARRVEEHKAKAAKLKALAAELGEFVTKHAARREALLKGRATAVGQGFRGGEEG